MKVETKTTLEISDGQWPGILNAFNENFGRTATQQDLTNFYRATPLGYSIHAMAIKDGEVAGFTSIVPRLYRNSEGNILTGLSASSFVGEKYRRDILIFHDMYAALRVKAAEVGIKVILGVPNENSRKYLEKFLAFEPIIEIPYYLFPLGLPKMKNPFARTAISYFLGSLLYVNLRLTTLIVRFYNPKEISSGFEVVYSESEFKGRFPSSKYQFIRDGSISAVYRVVEEKSGSVAYLFDFRQSGERTLYSLAMSLKAIVRNEKVDTVVFIGVLHLRQWLLYRLPSRMMPRAFHLMIDIIEGKDSAFLNKARNRWNFGLLNFDVR